MKYYIRTYNNIHKEYLYVDIFVLYANYIGDTEKKYCATLGDVILETELTNN